MPLSEEVKVEPYLVGLPVSILEAPASPCCTDSVEWLLSGIP